MQARDCIWEIEDYDNAIADFTLAMNLDNECYDVFNNRGIAYCYQGYVDEAINDISMAITINQVEATFFMNRAKVYYRQDKYIEVLADLSDCDKA